MVRWGKASLASVAVIAIATGDRRALAATRHRSGHGATKHQRSLATNAAAAASRPTTPISFTAGWQPVAQRPRRHKDQSRLQYDDGGFKDVDPKPASYELRAWAMMNRQTGISRAPKTRERAQLHRVDDQGVGRVRLFPPPWRLEAVVETRIGQITRHDPRQQRSGRPGGVGRLMAVMQSWSA